MQHGIGDFLTDRPIDNPPQGQFAPPPSFEREVMLSDVLAGHGYRCGYAGKWHMGLDQTPQHKFESWYTVLGGGNQNPRMCLNGQAVEENGYLADLITQRATRFLGDQKPDRPFFLVASYANPHAPYDGHPQKYYDLYAKTSFDTLGWEHPSANALVDREYLRDIVPNLRKCAASVTALDDQIPLLLKKLTDSGLRDNTLIVLLSDNGSLLGRHGLWADGHASDPINMYEEVTRVPTIWNWPGRVPVEGARPELVSLYDVVPTLCEAAGAEAPAGRNLCGRSYLSLATGRPLPKREPWRNLVFAHLRNTEMVRDNRFKLVVRNGGKGPNELFDLRNDAREKVNQYSNPQFVTVRDRLAGDLETWRQKYST